MPEAAPISTDWPLMRIIQVPMGFPVRTSVPSTRNPRSLPETISPCGCPEACAISAGPNAPKPQEPASHQSTYSHFTAPEVFRTNEWLPWLSATGSCSTTGTQHLTGRSLGGFLVPASTSRRTASHRPQGPRADGALRPARSTPEGRRHGAQPPSRRADCRDAGRGADSARVSVEAREGMSQQPHFPLDSLSTLDGDSLAAVTPDRRAGAMDGAQFTIARARTVAVDPHAVGCS